MPGYRGSTLIASRLAGGRPTPLQKPLGDFAMSVVAGVATRPAGQSCNDE
jgi:hypothetical protein